MTTGRQRTSSFYNEIINKVFSADDYYDLFALSKESTLPEIKKAYKKLVLLVHPDKNKETKAEAAFIRVSEAFQVLSDEDERKLYDRLGHHNYMARRNPSYSSSSSAATANSFFQASNHTHHQNNHGYRQTQYEYITPEELFRQMFGTNFSFAQNRSHTTQGNNSMLNLILRLLFGNPMIVIFVLVAISSLFGMFGNSSTEYQFSKSRKFKHLHKIDFADASSVEYFVTDKIEEDFKTHKKTIGSFDRSVVRSLLENTQRVCKQKVNLYRQSPKYFVECDLISIYQRKLKTLQGF
eukprot:TRINITY_DN3120_c0_g4_i1.p1 TRINITY_DN3120_c0_g4~~TRINITY_DN3120_c0_g4_i1.p1  ORF type:complete len:309 (+),score=58.23 TRINITY_DN3120_c0_g4_i1:43-927(+)